MVNWSNLQPDMLEIVAQHLTKIEDYANFGAVCTSWRAAASNEKNFKGIRLWQQIPCLMLSADDDKNENDVDREFYSLMDNEIVVKLSLPQIKGKKCFESQGWLATIGEQGDMSLLHPFTGAEIPLPHQNTFPEYDRYETDAFFFVRKVVLSCRPDDESSDFAVMMICGSVGFLAFWRPGDPSWNRIDTRNSPYRDVIYFRGQFYGIDSKGYVVVCDIKKSEAKIITRFCNIETVTEYVNELLDRKNVYLVAPQPQKSSEEKLLIVTRDGWYPDFVEDDSEDDDDSSTDFVEDDSEDDDDDDDSSTDFVEGDGVGYRVIYGTTGFGVYELDLVKKTWKVIKTLGNTAIFVGHSASMSVEASTKLSSASKIKPNHIYFTDDGWEAYWHLQEGGGKDMGGYSMETGSIAPFYPGRQRLSTVSPSIWVTTHF